MVVIWLLSHVFLHTEQNVSLSPNKAFSFELVLEDTRCPWRETVLHLSSHAVFWGCSNTVPKARRLALVTDPTRRCCRNALAKNSACGAQLWFVVMFI